MADWSESRDLKISFLKAGTLDLEEGTDIGIATALYEAASTVEWFQTQNLKSIV